MHDVAVPRRRDSARVLLFDDAGCVLLFEVATGADGATGWLTPGGGVEPGEAPIAAAARELAEETGLELAVDELDGPVAVCRGEWRFRGERLVSEDLFYVARAALTELRDDRWTELEREVTRQWRFWSSDELRATRAPVVPGGLAGLVERLATGWRPAEPVELPWATF